MSATVSRRDTNIPIRARAEDRDLIDRAARTIGQTRSEFMLQSARREAQNVLADQSSFRLDSEQWDAFIKALDKAPNENPRLRKLMKRKTPWETE